MGQIIPSLIEEHNLFFTNHSDVHTSMLAKPNDKLFENYWEEGFSHSVKGSGTVKKRTGPISVQGHNNFNCTKT